MRMPDSEDGKEWQRKWLTLPDWLRIPDSNEMRVAQSVFVVRQLPMMIIGNGVGVTIAVAAISTFHDWSALVLFYIGAWLLLLPPMLSWRRLRNRPPPEKVSHRRIRLLVAYSTVLGLGLAVITSLLLKSGTVVLTVFLLPSVGFLGIGAVAAIYMIPLACLGYVLPPMLTAIYLSLQLDDRIGPALTAMLLLMLLGQVWFLLNNWRSFCRLINLSQDKDLLLARSEAASRAKSDFLAVMSHELRTPLGAVIGAVDLLTDAPLSHDQRRLAQVALTSGAQLTDLIGNILDLTKLEHGKIRLDELPFELYEVIKAACQIAEIKAIPKGLEVICDIDEEVKTGRLGDPTRLRQVLVNLLANAVKFTERGSVRVRVSETSSSDVLLFRISDTGLGVPEDLQGAIFERFMQADQSATRHFDGAGLGLAISRELVSAMGGEIGIESAVGQGSTFWFTAYLPMLQKEEILSASISKAAVRQILTDGFVPRILLVEDAPENRMIIQQMLERLGYQVQLAENGEEGVQAALAVRFDAIIMDMRMPKLDGLGATRQIRGQDGPNRKVPIIALTGNAFEEDRQRGLAAGCTDYLAKPIRISTLREVLIRHVN